MSMTPADTRFEVRRHLAQRPTASLDLEAIYHGLMRAGLDADKPSIEAALAFLHGLQPSQVIVHKSSLNATRFQITSAGVVAFENNA